MFDHNSIFLSHNTTVGLEIFCPLASFSTNQNVASALLLDEDPMQTLVTIIYAAVSDFEHNNSTLSYIKTISSKQYISPEY